mgnify:FL=1
MAVEKPPLGIKPTNIWLSERINDLIAAMGRYTEAGYPVPIEWVIEYNKHVHDINN